MTSTTVIQESLRGVRHHYGDTDVLRGIDLDLPGGSLTALLGPSGSGKTTLLAIAGGLLRPAAGTVTVAGRDLYPGGQPDRPARLRTAYVLQASSLIGFLTARDNLLARDVAAGRHPGNPRRAGELLAEVGLAAKADRYPAELSGGERQRVAVASALYANAQIILADEPTAALDRRSGRAVIELLAGYARQSGAAVLAATHDERALDLATGIRQIEDGRLVP